MDLPKKRTLNILPTNPEQDAPSALGRFPSWLHHKIPAGNQTFKTDAILAKYKLNTVCEEARCPNRMECYSKKTATFLALGKECTRNCGFCDIDFTKTPKAPEADEPMRISASVKELGLEHVVITMVARDDLPDGGAFHIASIIRNLRENNQGTTIEVLTSDFSGSPEQIDQVLQAQPDIFNHNIETVRELTPRVRHKATYDRSLQVLSHAKNRGHADLLVKSGIMVGLGETKEQVETTILDLVHAGCDIITLGHYLQPSRQKLTVKSFVTPEEFAHYEAFGYKAGAKHVYAGPFVRSSYNALQVLQAIKNPLPL
ncbi:MAG: lipoyl synthase [Chlamydiae bacterium]|nr:lipoyl synthase [Chlamydiota bacterium]